MNCRLNFLIHISSSKNFLRGPRIITSSFFGWLEDFSPKWSQNIRIQESKIGHAGLSPIIVVWMPLQWPNQEIEVHTSDIIILQQFIPEFCKLIICYMKTHFLCLPCISF